jgi:predicted dienelactone hydrolase
MLQRFIAVILAGLVAISCGISRAAYDPDSPGHEVATFDAIWKDGARNREVPFRIYYPKAAATKLPVIIFSHGLGGSRDGYAYLGKYWAAHGFISVHLTHHGSDTEALLGDGMDNLRQRAQNLAMDPMNAVNRCKDVSFAIDELNDANENEKSPLKGMIDLSRIGMAGHSFGANTTMLIAGEMTRTGKSFADNRVKCAIALSPPVAVPKSMYDKAYSAVNIPLFVITGTRDDSPVGETMAADRRVPFDHVQNIPAFLITFDGATHMVFAGPRRAASPADARIQKLVQQGTTAFWDAYLRGDESAKTWLKDGGYAKLVGSAGVLEQKSD